jgi:signal transduction histidine kinase/sensor domain CHASE-containing protein
MNVRAGLLLLLPMVLGIAAASVGWIAVESSSNHAAAAFASARLEGARQLLALEERRTEAAAAAVADLDGAFDYVTTRDPAFARAQLTDQRLRDFDVDQVIVTDLRGSVLTSRAVPGPGDPGGTRNLVPNPAVPLNAVLDSGAAVSWSLTADGPLLIVARAIRPSAGGQSVRGMVIVARSYDAARLDALDRAFGGRLAFVPVAPGGQAAPVTDGAVRVDGWRSVTAFAVLADPLGQGAIALRVEPDVRDAAAAASTARTGMFVVVGLVSVMATLGGGVFAAISLRRVQRMQADVRAMNVDAEAPLDRLVDFGSDAIGDLGLAVAGALREMQEEARSQVMAAREATAGERLGEAILRGMGEGVVLLRADGVCQVCNAAAAAALGIEARTVVGDRFAMQQVLGPELLVHLAALAAGETARPTPIDVQRDGRSLSVTAEEFARDREAPGLLIRIRDVTAIVEAEGLRRDLVSIVSHDLRTPLTVIASTIELLRGARGADAPPEDERMLELMDRNVERMQELIGDLLDSASLDAGQMQFDFDVIDIGALAREMADLHRPQADARHMGFYVEVPPEPCLVRGDRRRLRQVLANLLGNAVKYADDGAQVWLRVLAADGRARVEVINTGHPIAPADQARIFEKFYRGEHSRRSSRGTGLGLAISRQIAEAHGGSLWLERSDAASNVFVLALPLLAAEATV